MTTEHATTDPKVTTHRVTIAAAFSADLIPGVLFVLALALFAPRIQTPDKYIYDEVYHAYTAGQYAAGNHDAYLWNTTAPNARVAYMWNHPPAGIDCIAASILVWGDNPFGWRIGSAIFGAAGIVVAYLLALAMTGRKSVAVTAALLLLADGLYLVQSRTAMLDIYGTVFMLGALHAFHAYLSSPPERARAPLLRVGLFLGLAVATKWNAAYASALIGLTAIGRGVLLAIRSRGSLSDAGVRAHLLWVPLALVALPACVYFAAYLPFFLTGHDLTQFVELQKQIFHYHTHLEATHPYQSRWWEWPLTLRPVWYSTTHALGKVSNVYTNGNSVLYLAFIPATLWLAWRLWRRRDPALAVLLIGFYGQWLPWALVHRIAFAYHFLPAVPFGCLAIAVALSALYRKGAVGRAAAIVYVCLAVGFFIYFFPINADVPLTPQAFESRMWLSSWR
jgi:dolichyl-phosphate-mannose--protein O-mannosyl transferase